MNNVLEANLQNDRTFVLLFIDSSPGNYFTSTMIVNKANVYSNDILLMLLVIDSS